MIDYSSIDKYLDNIENEVAHSLRSARALLVSMREHLKELEQALYNKQQSDNK